jgi:L-threonate 2-dehydrogenase
MAAPSLVGMIGLGLMGTALAARLIDAGIPVIGFDIDPAKRKSFGGKPTASIEAVMSRCPTMVIAVFNAEQIGAVFDACRNTGLADLVICATTCAPDEILRLSNRAAQLRLRFVEAPISGTSAEVRAGSAMALIAGETAAIDAAAAVLSILCPRQTRVGRPGDAARTKLAINLVLQNNRAALAEGIAFAESMGLDLPAFLATLCESAAYSRVMDTKGQKMLTRDFTAQSHIAQTLKDAELILEEARQRKQHLPMTWFKPACFAPRSTWRDPTPTAPPSSKPSVRRVRPAEHPHDQLRHCRPWPLGPRPCRGGEIEPAHGDHARRRGRSGIRAELLR